MKRKSPFKQFAKDCPEHFSKEMLMHPHLESLTQIRFIQKEKSTRNSSIKNKF